MNPAADFAAGELCTVIISAAGVTDDDATDPPNTMNANYVFSFTTGSPVVPPAVGDLVINEIDYDQPGTDAAEFLEIKNVASTAVNLNGVIVDYINGNLGGAASYLTTALPNVVLAAGDYYVVCANGANTPNCDLDITPDTNLIQNGSPDAVALRVGTTILDTVSYEGNTGAPYTEGSGVGLEDAGAGALESISRCPDGTDTNTNNVDLQLRPGTPGVHQRLPRHRLGPECLLDHTGERRHRRGGGRQRLRHLQRAGRSVERLLDLVRHLRRPL